MVVAINLCTYDGAVLPSPPPDGSASLYALRFSDLPSPALPSPAPPPHRSEQDREAVLTALTSQPCFGRAAAVVHSPALLEAHGLLLEAEGAWLKRCVGGGRWQRGGGSKGWQISGDGQSSPAQLVGSFDSGSVYFVSAAAFI